jgi:SAM-dependent methyltransferase
LKLLKEIQSFDGLWKGGFKTGYSKKRNQRMLENYLKASVRIDDRLLEIGCGGGQWTKFLYPYVDTIICIDVLSAKHNNFWSYVGSLKSDKIRYWQVSDFSLSQIPDNSLDYVFSYDTFCHISYSGQREYLKNLQRKCKDNALLLIMYADPVKYLGSEPENLEHIQADIPGPWIDNNVALIEAALNDKDGKPSPGRWYWVGIKYFIELCEEYNYEILERDLDIDKTNPITLFRRSNG